MRDIVTTIQAEQDAIIRLPLSGVVVIEGGPGTGKTAVALHRVAYLLYTHRERLARSGVLVVGPSAGFIRYVGGVLPALGESAVVFTTPGRLAHGVVATAVDPDEVARTKGGLAMLDVLRRAVADRQELPGSPIAIELDDVTVEIDRATAAEARRRARATGLPHNAARATFRDTLGSLLVEQGVERLDQDLEDPPELAEILRELGDHPGDRAGGRGAAVGGAAPRAARRPALGPRLPRGGRAALAGADPGAGPRRALRVAGPAGLGRRRDRPVRAAPRRGLRVDGGGRAAARRAGRAARSRRPARQAAAERACDSAYAAEVLSILESADRQIAGEDPDELRPTDFVTADVLAARQVPEHLGASPSGRPPTGTGGTGISSSTRRRSSPPWTGTSCCGAALRTRSPRWATSRSAAPPRERRRGRTCSPRTSGARWTYRTLTVNYRTPAEIMALAAAVLAEFAPDRQPPESVRATGEDPWQRTVPAADLAAEVRTAVEAEVAQLGRGTLAVIAADLDGLAGLPAQLHTPVSAKGLEFDAVVIVDPERIRAHNPADLYVSMTRATQRLGLLHVER